VQKYKKDEKQGMMQELPTGRIRLIAWGKMATQPVPVDA